MSSRPSRGAARLAAILDALPDALLLVNCNGTIVNANHIALESFETPGTALVGRGLLDLLPSFDPNRIPGSMRRPADAERTSGTKPTRMIARRTDGTQVPVEVTSANVEDGRTPYADQYSYTGDELLMLIVRDLTGTLDTEAELARQQRQTEMILRAAAEGVVGVDTEGKVVLVNPAAAQILGFRASDLGGQELHSLVHHSRPDGSPFPYEESPLADTLRSGRKHRVRGQVLWAKEGSAVPVDLTTAPVRDGEQLVGAVMTFTDRRAEEALVSKHAEEVESLTAQHGKELEELRDEHAKAMEELQAQLDRERQTYAERLDALAARNGQLLAVLDQSLRGPLQELRSELGVLADDPAGQLWPEANQILHHLAAGYTRMTTLVDNVLSYQRLDADGEPLARCAVSMDEVVAAGVEGAVELIGPGRAQFAVHAPPIEAEVDPQRVAQALAHLIADVAGVDSTGKTASGGGGASGDSTIVVAAAQRGNVVRFEVRGPYAGGDPVHEPIVRGIVRRHGGVLQTHEMPGMGGHAYVLEVPISAAAADQERAKADAQAASGSADGTQGTQGQGTSGGGTGASTSTSGGGADSDPNGAPGSGDPQGGGPAADTSGAQNRSVSTALPAEAGADPQQQNAPGEQDQPRPTGRRRARPAPDEAPSAVAGDGTDGQGAGAGPHGAQGSHGAQGQHGPQPVGPAAMGVVPPQGMAAQPQPPAAGGRRRGSPAQEAGGPYPAQSQQGGQVGGRSPFALPPAAADANGQGAAGSGESAMPALPAARTPEQQQPAWGDAPQDSTEGEQAGQPTGRRRARRPLSEAPNRSVPEQGRPQPQSQPQRQAQPQPQPQPAGEPGVARSPFALPPAAADRAQPGALPPELGPAGPAGLVPAQPGGRDPRIGAPQAQAQPQGGGLAVRGEPVPPGGTARGGRWPSSPGQSPQQAPQAPAQQGQNQGQGGPQAPRPGTAGPGAGPGAGTGAGPGAGTGESAMPSLPAARTPEQQQPAWGEAPQDSLGGQQAAQPTGRRRARRPLAEEQPEPAPGAQPPPQQLPPEAPRTAPPQGPPQNARQAPQAPQSPQQGAPQGADTTQGRAFSVRTLGQGVPFAQQVSEHQRTPQPQQPQTPSGGTSTAGSGRRRKLAARPDMASQNTSAELEPAGTRAHPQAPAQAPGQAGPPPGAQPRTQPGPGPQPPRPASPQSSGRAFAIGAPDEGAEGPEPLDGPNGAIEIVDDRTPPPDDELPPEPLDNPRRLLVWPAPDMSTQQALSDRGYRPVIVNSREEVDAQIAAYPAALFVDPLTGPITRTALQSLRAAAVAAEVPVLVTAGLGQATREAAYGADPAVLLKALAPRDSEQHPPRVLLIEEHEPIAAALTAALERRGMQVARAATDADAVALAGRMRPNLVVMDLMQVRRRRAGIVDWLRGNGLLNRTPLVVYTSADIDPANLTRLSSGETVLFLAERSTSAEVQARIVDLLAKIGTN
ncbi:PAS domain-containing protein [Streptomyces sp. Rer75]|uniref:response regulator n=1 Tax=Streptomyces sp. Rer75 TaxID=2750011 RepID=UPI0015CFCC51|nr:PAS domain-containing protein [Streptomyces sp. Rer75]QLH22816.1 PAS domain-containing protein [Streptomyces sp. Rer75]